MKNSEIKRDVQYLTGRKNAGYIDSEYKNKSENQMKTLAQTILPRIALHKCLSEEGFSEEDVYKYMRKYMLDKVAAKNTLQRLKWN